MRVKDTLNLGKTKFKMRGNLPVNELKREQVWEENKLYEQRQKLNEGKPTFILHDGPPYANGNIHMGHAMNKVSKDIIVRYKSMAGYRSPYVPGWDTHGLPIEQQLKKAGYDRKKMTTTEFRKLCRDYALKQVEMQKADFKRLGVAGEWDNPYLTLKPEFEAQEIRTFGKMAEQGLIYKGKHPVFWSWSSESAMAEAEVEYHDVTSPSAFFAEQVVDGKGVLDTDTYLVVWTTTPWTIPASEGVTIDADFDYSVVQPEGETRKFVIATELVDNVTEKFGWENVKVLKTVKGADMDRVLTQHPFYPERKLVVMLGDFVTLDAGTGLVHTAPGFGEDDFRVGQQYGLDILVPVNDQGYMTDEAGKDFAGVFYDDANKIALDKLKAANLLLDYMPYKHSYPFDWRTKKPVIFRATPQWFASVDKIRDKILKAIDDVKFTPSWGQKRLYNMIRDRGDWVISRQRVWGVPLPIFYGEDGEAIMTKETIGHVADLFEKYGSDVWFDREAKDLLPEGFTSEHSPNGKFTKETDIMDVWFDSGSSHQGVLAERDYLTYPADLYLEGSDQYRGWFNSSLITSVAVSGKSPYKQVVSQGFTLDGQGHKMSKSLGNTIVPSEVIKKMGAEIVRLWVASVDSSSDVRVSMENFVKISDSYKKLRNTLRYLLANTTDYDPKTDKVAYQNLESADKYMLIKYNKLVQTLRDDYEKYDFLNIYKRVMNFVITDLSAFYLDFAKDVVYIDPEKSQSRRSMQTVFYEILVGLTKLLTPILPHTTEEIWEYLKEPEEFVQLAEMPEVQHFADEETIFTNWEKFKGIRSNVLKTLEEARDAKMIGKSMEAQVNLYVDKDTNQLLNDLNTNVRLLLIISKLEVEDLDQAPADADQFKGMAVKVSPAQGSVCARCRMTKTDVGSDTAYPELCARCAKIVRENYPETVEEGLEA
ncbi:MULTISPECIES: isoleucine--tRNA ligase [Pediococcus]|uniref:Isoleucine--tRNA ligase n=1 Tax=Pediococcus parvulus TaxID=54062 RepID=A0AAP5TCY5_9LACO|nr:MULTISPECIES: isoleucine--tRNA ligase [Pediococcus]MCT3028663.1 isoleucine--tRNA ligase [Pediococcus parvulus]MCT3031274.1 isoleucine--tRNA ligase [Pediococcus parvulus]MCT3034367.1 isoleucine--tRNA ligase [Pediococcus parvulus]MDV7694361.1 isoleucine--tRNA ligase [Pediococcus parvulus]HBO47825.1 isoleucine--tRNA ligase [Pediococcus sp.]